MSKRGTDMVRLVSGIVVREGRILLVRRRPGLPGGARWGLPEGTIPPGEPWLVALVRAVRDEVGILVNVAEKTAIPFSDGTTPGLRAVCYPVNPTTPGGGFIELSARLEEFRWVLLDELRQDPDMVPHVTEEVVCAMEAGFHGVL